MATVVPMCFDFKVKSFLELEGANFTAPIAGYLWRISGPEVVWSLDRRLGNQSGLCGI